MKRVAESNEPYLTEKKSHMSEKSSVVAANEAAARLNQKIGLPANIPVQLNGCTTQTINWSIPDKYVGLIIGKQGLQISNLQNDSHCKVQISPEGGRAERALTLIGTPQEIETAKDMIQNIISRAERTNPGMMGNNQMSNMAPNADSFLNVEIRVPGNKAGLVIGRNGETIKNLQEEHGVKMVLIQQTNAATLEDKPLKISGERSKVERVKQIVHELINSRDPKKPVDGQEMTHYAVPAEKAGLIIGKSGESIKEICRMSGAHVEISKEPVPNPAIKIFNIRGGPVEIDQAIRMISDRAGIPVTKPATIPAANSYYGYAQDPNSAAAYGGTIPPPTYNPYTGQPDYSAAWIEYYRRLGLHDQAEAIQRQAQQQAQAYSQAAIAGAQAAPGAPQPGLTPQGANPNFAANAGNSSNQPGGNQVDYAQWQQWQQQQWQWQQQQQWQGAAANSNGGNQPGQRISDGLHDNV